jgi:hypothetical protein
MDAPPNRGSFNSAHIFGTYVPGGGAVHSIMSRLMGRSKTASLGAIRRRVPPKPLGLGGA